MEALSVFLLIAFCIAGAAGGYWWLQKRKNEDADDEDSPSYPSNREVKYRAHRQTTPKIGRSNEADLSEHIAKKEPKPISDVKASLKQGGRKDALLSQKEYESPSSPETKNKYRGNLPTPKYNPNKGDLESLKKSCGAKEDLPLPIIRNSLKRPTENPDRPPLVRNKGKIPQKKATPATSAEKKPEVKSTEKKPEGKPAETSQPKNKKA